MNKRDISTILRQLYKDMGRNVTDEIIRAGYDRLADYPEHIVIRGLKMLKDWNLKQQQKNGTSHYHKLDIDTIVNQMQNHTAAPVLT